ncbi:alpha-glucosidase [Pseudactinotalea sp.]|uniref:alpha-glucosidase n=1 Tax=Pseudactinotalea sp. TaxID=1926260 RepID=UPI003B3A9C0A
MAEPRPRRRRRVLTIVAVVVALVVGAGVVTWLRIPRDAVEMLEAGSLRFGADFPATMGTGEVTVRIDADPRPHIAIETSHGTVWSSDPGTAFLGAGAGRLEVEESRGYFWMRTDHDQTWTTQTLDRIAVEGEAVVLSGRLLDGDEAGPTWQAEVTPTDRGAMFEATLSTDSGATSIALWSAREGSVHGFGEQFTDFDLDGALLPILVREQGVGRGEQPITVLADVTNHGAGGTREMTYAAWASWVSEDLRGVRLDPALPQSHALAVADMRTPSRVGLELQATRLRAEFVTAETPVDLIAQQQHGTERPPLASWTGTGAIVGIQGGTQVVRDAVASLQEAGTEIAGVWLQDWTGQRTTDFGERLWWTWQLDEQRYPDWAGLVSDLGAQGIAVTSYVNPFLVDPADKPTPPARNLYAEAAEQGFLVADASGEPYALDQGGFDAYLVDLTNESARAWFAEVIATEVLGDGVQGFMADFAEGLPLDAVLADGDAPLLHNRWPALWTETVQAACEQAGQPECVTWFRSGSLGMDASAALFWNGDQLVSFADGDGLASVLGATFSAGVSGWPLVHSDVGGYTSIDAVVKQYVRSPELLARWAEFAAFGVVMRTHEGNRPAENLQVSTDADTRAAFARASRFFAALSGYRAEVVAEATATGVPAIRHGWLVAPGTAAAAVDTQFFLGDAVLVAPVLSDGATDVEVTFPPGQWRHLLTGEVYDGDVTTTVAAPIGTPAAFVDISDPWAQRLTDAFADL